ncbi:exonuclease VIII [Vibrio phage K375]
MKLQQVVEYKEGMKIEVGKYYLNMPNDIYHGSAGDSKSSLDVFHEDPYKYFHPKERKQTRPMQLGSAIHAACLEPDVFNSEYILLPELKDRRQAEYKQAVKSFGEGKVFTNDDCKKITGMQKAVHANGEAHALLTAPGYFEVSGFSRDPETGLLIRHRFDKLAFIDGEWVGVDLKKTQGANQYKFSKSIWDYRYHVQDAIYSKGFENITNLELSSFKFIAVEEEYPHKVAVYELCDASRKIGQDEARMDLNSLAEYKSGKIKAHNNSECEIISLPEWVLRQFEDEVI